MVDAVVMVGPLAYISWRSKLLAGGTLSPFDRATARQVSLKRKVSQLTQRAGADPNQLSRLLVQAQRIKLVVDAEAVRDPAMKDPRKTAKPNTGRLSKPDLPGAPRGCRTTTSLGIIG